MNRKTILELAVFTLLSAVAIAGWVRRPERTNAASISPQTTEFAAESGAYANDGPAGHAVEDNGSANFSSISSKSGINRAQGDASPCAVSAKPAAYNESYYTGPYSSSNRPVRVSSIALPPDESHASAQTSQPGRTASHGRASKRSQPVGWRSVAANPATGDPASSATAAFVYDRLSAKKSSGF